MSLLPSNQSFWDTSNRIANGAVALPAGAALLGMGALTMPVLKQHAEVADALKIRDALENLSSAVDADQLPRAVAFWEPADAGAGEPARVGWEVDGKTINGVNISDLGVTSVPQWYMPKDMPAKELLQANDALSELNQALPTRARRAGGLGLAGAVLAAGGMGAWWGRDRISDWLDR